VHDLYVSPSLAFLMGRRHFSPFPSFLLGRGGGFCEATEDLTNPAPPQPRMHGWWWGGVHFRGVSKGHQGIARFAIAAATNVWVGGGRA